MEKLYVSSKDHYAEFQILDAELHFKNFLPIQNDSALSVAYAHFDSLMPGLDVRWEDENVGYQKARACYTKAVVEEFKERKCVVAFFLHTHCIHTAQGLKTEASLLCRPETTVFGVWENNDGN